MSGNGKHDGAAVFWADRTEPKPKDHLADAVRRVDDCMDFLDDAMALRADGNPQEADQAIRDTLEALRMVAADLDAVRREAGA